MISFKGRPDSGSSSEKPRAYKSGPRQGSTQAPSYAELRNPTLVTSSISLDTNVTTSVPLMVRPWIDKWEQKMNQGSVLFVWGSDQSKYMQIAGDICTVNYLLENSFNRLKGQSPMTGEYDVKKIEQYKWNLFGIVRNDLLADSSLQKLYNCDVFGRAMIANIFGPLKRNDHVGLALVATDCNVLFTNVFYAPNGRREPALKTKLSGSDKHFQIVGTRNGKIDEFLTSKDPNMQVLKHYPLGVVSHAVAKIPTQGNILLSLRSQDSYMLLPRVEILMI